MVESGGHGLLTFRRQDLIVVSPGVPMDTPELMQAQAFGLPVIGRAGAGFAVFAGAGGGDYGVEWEDDDYYAGGRDFEGGGVCQRWWAGTLALPVIERLVAEGQSSRERRW